MGVVEMNIQDQPAFAVPDNVFAQKVVSVRHYTDRLFKFRITRPASFRFRSGEFVMIGLPNAEKPVYRAYSIASPSWDEEIEFFSIKVPGGPLTEHLQKIVPGDTILMRKKPTGTLVNDALLPGSRLWLFSTGTGVAPFASIVRDPETYEKFDEVVLVAYLPAGGGTRIQPRTGRALARRPADRRVRRTPALHPLGNARTVRAQRPHHHHDRERRNHA